MPGMKQMVYKTVILEEAKEDIKKARAYYRKILKSLSKRFTADIKEIVAKIRNKPFNFGFRFDEFRTANLSVFPYQIHYIVDEANSTIIIFAVLHAYRDPNFVELRMVKR